MREIIATKSAPEAIGAYSQGIKMGNMVFTSGQLPINPVTGELITEIKEATKTSIENAIAIVEAAGLTKSDIVKCTIFIKDLNNFADANAVFSDYFSDNPPARSCVEVARLPKDAVIEIEAIAIK